MRAQSPLCTILLLLFVSCCLWGTTRGQAEDTPTPVLTDEPTIAPVVVEEPDIPVGDNPTVQPTVTLVEETEAPVPFPTIAPVVTVTREPTFEPTEVIEPTEEPTIQPTVNTTTNAPMADVTLSPVSRAPTLAPVSASPTVLNVTSAPSLAPTSAPTNLTETEPPTEAPSVSARPSPEVIVPTLPPTKRPVTNAPVKAPTKATRVPTALPTPLEAPGTDVERTILNIQVTFVGATEMIPSDAVEFQNEMKDWFDSYYEEPADDEDGEEEERQRRLLRSGHQRQVRVAPQYRRLQNELPILARMMDSTFDVTKQDTQRARGSNVVTYTLTMAYFALEGAQQPKDYALLPFADTSYNNELVNRLVTKFPASFANVVGPIDIPDIASSEPTPPSSNSKDKGFWTAPVIAGFASGGGVVFLVCCCAFAYCMGSRGARHAENGTYQDSRTHKTKFDNEDDDDDDDDNHHDMLPTQFQMSSIGGNDDDIISTMDDPTVVNKMHSIDASAMSGGYGDQSVATVDYDYSKAYGGGGGDQSVVSSVGGTLGDATRQTAGDVLAGSAAARAALGASFEDPRGGRRIGNGMNNATRDEVMVIDAPAGKLGVVIDTPDDGAPVVHAVKETSVIAHLIQVGDKLIKVDEEDVRSMTAIKVSKLISKKSANPVRRLTIVRTFHENP